MNLNRIQRRYHQHDSGFTRVELMAVLLILTLLGALALPILANGKSGSQRAVCVNNLSRVGQGFALWGTDYGDYLPSQVLASAGGTRNLPSGLNQNLWYQYAWVSNELATPKILACPSDPSVRMASEFSFAAQGGFLNPTYQNNAISYILGWPYFEDGRLVLSADRSIPASLTTGSQSGLFPTYFVDAESPALSWLSGIHSEGGNLLFNDGSVDQVADAGLKAAMKLYPSPGSSARSSAYFQYPRAPNR